nr:hypothetical protein [Lachnospiraceae bacterium]
FVPDYPLYVIDVGHDEKLSFPNSSLEDLRITLSAIYSDTADKNESEIDGSIMSLAGILAGDYKLYKAANYDGRQRMCKVLEARDEKIKKEVTKEYEGKLKEKEAALSEKEAALSEKEAALSEKDAALSEKEAALSEKDAALSEKDAALSEKDAALSEKDAEIERLKARIAELQK